MPAHQLRLAPVLKSDRNEDDRVITPNQWSSAAGMCITNDDNLQSRRVLHEGTQMRQPQSPELLNSLLYGLSPSAL